MKFIATSPVFYFFASIFILYCISFVPRYRKTLYFLFLPIVIASYLLLTGFGANIAVKIFAFQTSDKMCEEKIAVLLPSGLTNIPSKETDYSVINNSTFKRTHAAIEWLKKDDQRTLIISGDGAGSRYAEAKLLYNYISEFGIKKSRLSYEDQSTSTHLSAKNVSQLIEKNNPASKDIVLITSELHMRRALGTFKKVGFNVCPLISDYQYQDTFGFLRFFPNGSATHKSQAVLHEVVGYLWYSWTQRL